MFKKIISYFAVDASIFRPYYEKENEFGRLAFLYLVTAFLITPVFIYLLHFLNVSPAYFYFAVSIIILLPIYVLLGWFVVPWRNKIIHFLWYHQFVAIYFIIIDLVSVKFNFYDVFCFILMFFCSILTFHRTLQLILYSSFVGFMLIYCYAFVSNPGVPGKLLAAVIIISAFLRIVINFSRERILRSIEDYSNYLTQTVENNSEGYILSLIRKKEFLVIDTNKRAHELFETMNESTILQTKLNALFKVDDYIGLIYGLEKKQVDKTKKIQVGNRYFEVTFGTLTLKNNVYLLIRVIDKTGEINEENELIRREKKYRNLYYKNQAGVFTLDQNGVVLDHNESFSDMFHETFSIGSDFFQAESSEWKEIYDSVSAIEYLKNYQTHVTLKNGEIKWFVFNYHFDVRTNQVEGTVVDVSDVQNSALALRESEEKYRLIYEESNDAIVLLENDKIIDANRKAVQLFGRNKKELLKLSLSDLSQNTQAENLKKYHKLKLKLHLSKSTRFNWFFQGEAAVIEAELSFVELYYGKVMHYQCVIHDVTQQNKALRLLEQSKKSLQAILDNNPEGIIILSEDKDLMYSNKEVNQLLGKEVVDVFKLFKGSEQDVFMGLISTTIQLKQNHHHTLVLNSADKSKVVVDVTMVATNFLETSAILIILKDTSVQMQLSREVLRAELAEETTKKLQKEISQRIKAEKELENLFLKTKAIYESSSNTFLITLNLSNEITSYNTHLRNYFQRLTKKRIRTGKNLAEYFNLFYTTINLRYFEFILFQVKKGASRQIESKFSFKNDEFWLEIFINPILDSEGEIIEISLVAHDITEKKISEKEIKESLNEKEILLKEIHHRVKNNLQVISSILNLQSSFIEDEKTITVLQESRNRIHSMATIHEDLYRTSNFGAIVFSDYLLNLSTNLISTYRLNEQLVTLNFDSENILLSIDQAVPCGLLINEVISNALKYAFPNNKKGTIFISLKAINKTIILKVKDDGVGLPKGFNIEKSDTLGLQLVQTLAEQLEGKLEMKSENGTEILITFERR